MPPKKQASKSTTKPREVWYQLVSASNGKPFKGASVDAIIINPNALMFQVRDAIYQKSPDLLKPFGIPLLQLFENESSFKMMHENGDREPLSPAGSIGTFEASFENPIIVVVPDSSLAIPGVNQVFHAPSVVALSQYNSLIHCLQPCGAPFYRAVFAASEQGDWISFGEAMPGTSLKKLYVRESYRKLSSQMLGFVVDFDACFLGGI